MLTIGQVAAKARLSTSAIRYYEKQGLLPLAVRSGGKRVYDNGILARLAVIELAKQAGFEIREVRAVLAHAGTRRPSVTWAELAALKRAALEDAIAQLATMKAVLAEMQSCACQTLTECGRKFETARARLPARNRPTPRERATRLSRRKRDSSTRAVVNDKT